jgi:hypothetical protein
MNIRADLFDRPRVCCANCGISLISLDVRVAACVCDVCGARLSCGVSRGSTMTSLPAKPIKFIRELWRALREPPIEAETSLTFWLRRERQSKGYES